MDSARGPFPRHVAANVTLGEPRVPSATFAAIYAAFVEFGPDAAAIVTLTASRWVSGCLALHPKSATL